MDTLFDSETGPAIAFDYFEYDFMKLSEFSPILYNSIFTSIYSKLEITIYSICDYCKLNSNLKISAKDISGGNYIQRGKKYLEKVIEINFESIDHLWSDVYNYQQIRNIIVHANGKREIKERNLLKFISNQRGIVYNKEKHEVKIENKYFLLDFCSYFEKLVDGIVEQIIEQKTP